MREMIFALVLSHEIQTSRSDRIFVFFMILSISKISSEYQIYYITISLFYILPTITIKIMNNEYKVEAGTRQIAFNIL